MHDIHIKIDKKRIVLISRCQLSYGNIVNKEIHLKNGISLENERYNKSRIREKKLSDNSMAGHLYNTKVAFTT